MDVFLSGFRGGVEDFCHLNNRESNNFDMQTVGFVNHEIGFGFGGGGRFF